MVKFGPNPDWTPIFSQFGRRLTTPPRLGRSPGKANSDQNRDLRSFGGVVKRHPNWLKIGFQAGFGPNFTMEFEAFFQKKFGKAYWSLRLGQPLKKGLSCLNRSHYPPLSERVMTFFYQVPKNVALMVRPGVVFVVLGRVGRDNCGVAAALETPPLG